MSTVVELEDSLARAQATLAAVTVVGGDRATVRLSGAALRQHQARTDAQMRRYIAAEDAVQDAEWRLCLARARADHTPKPTPVMPDVHVGDRIQLVSNAVAVVAKVNRKSVVTESGVRWTAGEFEVIR